MTFVSFFQAIKSALEWAVNSKTIFAVCSVLVTFLVLYPAFGFIWRFIHDNFIFYRRLK